MRHLLISGLMTLATLTAAMASDRYPAAKRYVNQAGQVVTVGQSVEMNAYAEVPVRRALPPLQIVPVLETPIKVAPRLVEANRPASRGLLGVTNTNPADWPSGRTCCRPGQPYFNENPNS